jgi:hypothetical protein
MKKTKGAKMSDIKDWSNSAGGNTAASPNGWPENMAPSGVNDSARENMAALRRQHEDAEWIDRGETPTFATTASFTLAGDKSTTYHAGRRIKASDSTNTLYGTIASSTYSATTRVSVTLDSGQFTSSLSAVAVGILSFTNPSGDVVFKTGSQTIAGPKKFTSGVTVENAAPFYKLIETGATVDEGKWRILADGDFLKIQTLNDAEDTVVTALALSRTGTTVDLIDLQATTLQHNGVKMISEAFTSSEQDISSGAQRVMAHGLSVTPYVIATVLKCKTAQYGYSVDDELLINPASNNPGDAAVARGMSLVTDSTNITIRFSQVTGVFGVLRKDTGTGVGLTDANWKLIIKAWG